MPIALENFPKLFHLGTQRAGSSYLFNLLRSHPNVSLSPSQEIHFYTKNFNRGEDWYLKNFHKDGIRIDTSPKYFIQGKEAAPRIRELLKGERPLFLLLLRNPVDYVHSHFQLQLRTGSFNKRFPNPPKSLIDLHQKNPRYIERGLYYKTLKDYWLSHFDKSQFKIFIFERFISNTPQSIQEILEFFNLPTRPLTTSISSRNSMLKYPFLYKVKRLVTKNQKIKNILKGNKLFSQLYTNYLTEKPKVSEIETREWLTNVYSDDVQYLKDLLGDGIEEWKEFNLDSV